MEGWRGGDEKGERNLTKGAERASGSAFPMGSPISSWQIHTLWHQWSLGSKMDMAHLREPSSLLHHMRCSGPRIF